MGDGAHSSDSSNTGWRSRKIAAELLLAVLNQRKTLDEVLAEHAGFDALVGPDRGFTRAMTSAALRQLGRLDHLLASMVEQPLSDLQAPVLNLLRIGTVQIVSLGTADHAAVGQTVEAARNWKPAARGASLINAVLRRVARERDQFDKIDPIEIWPHWLKQRFQSGLGVAAARELARAQLSVPPLDLTCPSNRTNWAEALSARPISRDTLRREMSGSVDELPGYEEGQWWVQDVAAALPAHILDAQPRERVGDLCAAPGGKTLQLCATGAKVTAIDRSKARLSVLRQNLERTGFSAEIVTANAETWRPEMPFDRILLDAPCSALGTLRRHPEGAHIKSPHDIARFPSVQLRLLNAAAEMIVPGGSLVYCVCSPLPEEGEEVIAAAIATGQWSRSPIASGDVSGFGATLTGVGDIRTLPHLFESPDGCDAFYIARLTRSS